ncbi:unnamed protein product, partial [Mesorhabditis belari]|uniref:SET domain-containing protein n=1 Tax=Mesorhabditis belari TaxID=2138241 RepID=A0AAF3JA54_9BILA
MELDTRFPELPKTVRINQDLKRGQFLEALSDIPPGVIVCCERGLSITLSPTRCRFCASKEILLNSSTCQQCESSTNCASITRIQDGLQERLQKFGFLELALRIVLSHSAEEITEVIQKFSSRKKFPITSSNKRRFELVANLQGNKAAPIDSIGVDNLLDELVDRLEQCDSPWISMPDYRKRFKEAIRFVMERLPDNAHSIFDVDQIAQIHDMHAFAEESSWILHREVTRALEGQSASHRVHSSQQPIALGLFPISSLINHSCHPNTYSYTNGNMMIYRSRGIRKGDEITDSYGPNIWNHTLEERRVHTARRGFDCWCSACENSICLQNVLEGTTDGDYLTDEECLLDADQLEPDFDTLIRKFRRISQRCTPGNQELDRFAHFIVAMGVRKGDLDLSSEALKILWKSLEARNLLLCPERGFVAHAQALILKEKWERSKDEAVLQQCQKSFFSALVAYRTFFGCDGLFAKELTDSFTGIFV